MYRILTCAAAGAFFISTAKADETLRYRYFTRGDAPQTQDVGDVEGHVLGLARLSGLISLPDGSVGMTSWTSSYDFIKGVGPFTSYGNFTFKDGSVLWWKVTGPAVTSDNNATANYPDSTLTVLHGTGRFAGAKGNGTVNGARITGPGAGALFAGEFVINIRK